MSRHRSVFWTSSWALDLISSTPPTCIRAGFLATRAANRKPYSAIGSSAAATARKSILATKVGIELAPDKKGLSKAYILQEVEDSLQRLQTDYIDLYQSHIDDASVPLEETLGAYDQLIKQGKVRAIGASNYTAERLAESFKVSKQQGLPRYECLQPHYNLYERAGFREGSGTAVLERRHRRDSVLRAGQRISNGQVPIGERSRQRSARSDGEEISGRARVPDSRARWIKSQTKLHSTPGKVAIAWLIARPEHYGSYRERDQRRAIEGSG